MGARRRGWVRGCSSIRNLYKRDVCLGWGPGWGWSEGLPAGGAPLREAASEEAPKLAALGEAGNLMNPTKLDPGVCLNILLCPGAAQGRTRLVQEQPSCGGRSYQLSWPPAHMCWPLCWRRGTILSPQGKEPVASVVGDPI